MSFDEAVLNAIQKIGGKATNAQIYSYLKDSSPKIVNISDFEHRVRNTLYKLKKHKKIANCSYVVYEVITSEQHKAK